MLITLSNVEGQISFPGKPSSSINNNIEFIELKATSTSAPKKVGSVSSQGPHLKDNQFADPVEVNISPLENGSWSISEGGLRIWQIGITSSKASSLGLLFDPFVLNPGCKLFIFTPSMDIVLGAYTFRNNKEPEIFAVMPIANDSLIIEIQVDPSVRNFGNLNIKQVGIGYPSEQIEKSETDEWYRTSAACNIDTWCIDNDQVKIQKHSVCRIIYNSSSRCTGTLLNNTREDGRALVLTAGHCIKTQSSAYSSLFFFDYESPYCNGPDGTIKSISGSKLLSRSEGLDFTLLELSEPVPLDYFPVFAGWDASEEPFNTSFTIHHPMGDVKKIAMNNEPVMNGSLLSFNPDVHWLVSRYFYGTTEIGSSGAALFDNNSRVRGTLTAGNAACSEYINDYYEKISHSWQDNTNTEEQLKYWLDPINSGVTKIDYHEPINELFAHGEEISNIGIFQNKINPEYINGWGYITGHNSSYSAEYAEHYYRNGSKYIYALNIDVARLFFYQIDSKIKFKIWNGVIVPQNVIYSKTVYLFELQEGMKNEIRLDSAVYVDKDFFVGYEIEYSPPLDTFAIYMAEPGTTEINTAYVRNDFTWNKLNDGDNQFNTSLAIRPLAFDFLLEKSNTTWELPQNNITLYPNPAKDRLQILFREKQEGEVIIKVYDFTGRYLKTANKQSPEPNFVFYIGDLKGGIYILSIEYSDKRESLKFVKF